MMRSLMHAAHTTPDLMRALREVFIEPERLDLQKMLRRAVARGEELARSARADVIVMDIRMPDLDGLQATRLITADDDLAGVRILILTTFELDEYVLRALRAWRWVFHGSYPGDYMLRLHGGPVRLPAG